MNKRKFPNYLGIISKPKNFKPIMEIAIVKDGYLIATDGYILAVTNLMIKYEIEELKNLEGKVFNREALTKLAKATYIQFEKDRIIYNAGKNTNILEYSGTIDDKNKVYLLNPITLEFKEHGIYPDYKKIMYGADTSTNEIKLDLSAFTNNYIGVNADYLKNAAEALLTESVIILGSELYKPLLIIKCLKDNKTLDLDNFVYLTKSARPDTIENALLL